MEADIYCAHRGITGGIKRAAVETEEHTHAFVNSKDKNWRRTSLQRYIGAKRVDVLSHFLIRAWSRSH